MPDVFPKRVRFREVPWLRGGVRWGIVFSSVVILGVVLLLWSSVLVSMPVAAEPDAARPEVARPPVEWIPLRAEIDGERRGTLWIYPSYVELYDPAGVLLARVGRVWVRGQGRLFVIAADARRALVGWTTGQRLYDAEGTLRGHFAWTNIQALAYDAEGMKLASAPCIAYQALCGAVLASYALGMLP